MTKPTHNHNSLWNDLPIDERKRLMPYQMESQILHIWQCKQKAIDAHKAHMKQLDDWMENIKRDLDSVSRQGERGVD
tara:strand:- start:43 stop:273 length:231 start_codon:yes stop_codon:yes gene_type:complete